MVLEPTSTFAPVLEAAAKKIVSELQDLEVRSCVHPGHADRHGLLMYYLVLGASTVSWKPGCVCRLEGTWSDQNDTRQ
jgi:hypothetical protein